MSNLSVREQMSETLFEFYEHGTQPNALREADALLSSQVIRRIRESAWLEGHAAGRDYQADGWNSDAHDPNEDNPYREEANV